MEPLLFLCHRIPYPPNKGDKVRSFHLLRYLSKRYRVFLGAFIDDPNDWQYQSTVAEYCADSLLLPLNPRLAKLRSLTGLITGEALSLPYYRNPAMQGWVEKVHKVAQPTKALVFSSTMAQYLNFSCQQSLQQVVDFVDVDSDKWQQYSSSKAWPMNWVYRRESQLLARFEQDVAARVAASVFVTPEEANLFREMTPENASRVFAIANGVDGEYFQPGQFDNPYDDGGPVMAFTGAMDYWANIDAVSWFTTAVLPRIQQVVPTARLAIVGARPTAAVKKLGTYSGVHVYGSVPDMRPYLAHARLPVAPLRIARGVQNKVLEAMAMAKSVLATPAAMEGIVPNSAFQRLVAESPEALAELAVAALRGEHDDLGELGRQWVLKHYHWPTNLAFFEHLLAGDGEVG